ncbi:fumarate/nitrate reduction transcriptional regulator Fnr [Parvibium lacunae]|uniref:Fumarate/nitrate reduction transcriptional regulator Fnr n=1 Tax=Parvibium lacunae TaxID=1888893 RepID=A0A368L7N4_9BURK|nr:fumarate/nitrate reduction transcriptional regulator Fnr [Parvibium lacunae]RCS59663.1 fumarate/nitrate reduction transcriptional regulator Fnr [Parvibium lacunae]
MTLPQVSSISPISGPKQSAIPASLHQIKTHCATCSMHDLCLPVGLSEADISRLDDIIRRRRRIKRGETLYRMGEKFQYLYAIRFGHFKAIQVESSGAEQITGFQMSGELLGLDGIATDIHQCDAIALEDSEVCEVPFVQLEDLFREIPGLQRHFHRMMSREITREQGVMLLLGSMRAEQRLAAFLLNLSGRYAARGYSANRFQLRMTREEIGNYLGLTVESISRLLTKFRQQDWLKVEQRELEIVNHDELKKLISGTPDEDCSNA